MAGRQRSDMEQFEEQKKPRGFKGAYKKAKEIVAEHDRVRQLVNAAQKKAGEQKEKLDKVWDDFQTLIRVVKAWLDGSYKQIPWGSIVYLVAALVYFVNPFDLVFDFIPGIGLIDDLSVIGFVIAAVKKDLENFKAWEVEVAEEITQEGTA